MGAWFVQYRTEICSIDRLLEKQGRFRACLSCFGNGNEKADSEGSPRGLQKTWIVKGALLTRLQKLEKSGFNLFCNAFYRVRSTSGESTPHQDEAAQRVTKCRSPSSSQFLSRFPTAGYIKQHN